MLHFHLQCWSAENYTFTISKILICVFIVWKESGLWNLRITVYIPFLEFSVNEKQNSYLLELLEKITE